MTAPLLVAGLINVETTVQIESFPIAYQPVRYPFFGVQSSVSGVGYNLAKALITLGHEVRFASLIGRDMAGAQVQQALVADRIPAAYVVDALRQTPQSAILYDRAGKRMIHTDLKDIQEQVYPPRLFAQALRGCTLAALCNINFTRPYLRLAQEAGVPIATDVHAIADLDDDYNRDYMAAASILFLSDERLPCSPEDWVQRLWERYAPAIVVVGMGGQGALLGVRSSHTLTRYPAVFTRPVVSTIGAGDALFSAFLHGFIRHGDPHEALAAAIVFASHKIGEAGAAAGFLPAGELEEMRRRFAA